MKASEDNLFDLIGRDRQQYQVPLYQRVYSWGTKQLGTLWKDILSQAESMAADSGSPNHFLGAVVLATSPLTEARFPRYIVVDGQQRLTTLTIALAALRDYQEASGDSDARARINAEFLLNTRSEGDDRFRLIPTQQDREAYRAVMLGLHHPDEGSAITRAYRFFMQKLAAVDDPADPYDIFHIEKVIGERLNLVSITVGADENAHRIYESLNNTGLRLSQADLLKNYLFMRLGEVADQVHRDHWQPIESVLDTRSSDEDQLSRLLLLQMALLGVENPRAEDLYSEQVKWFARNGEDHDTIIRYVEQLNRRSHLFALMIHPRREPDRVVSEHLHRLRQWGATTAEPAMLYLLDQRDAGAITSEQVARGLALIESFLVRRMIAWVPTHSLNRIFLALPSQLAAEPSPIDGIHRLLSAKRRYWPTDAEIREQFQLSPFYQRGRGSQRRYILQYLEESYGHPEPVNFASTQYTIEHVLPQKPSEDWFNQLAAECGEDETPEDLHQSLVHTIGNLTLTAMNADLSNHPFKRKRQIFDLSHLEANREIAEAPKWGAAEIRARADDLADRAIRIWPAPLAGVGEATRRRDWQKMHEVLAALPHASWTSYGAVARLIGSAAQAVGSHLKENPSIFNAHRVLIAEGKVAEGFRYADGSGAEKAREHLEADGIRFSEAGIADRRQYLGADDLAALLDPAD
ncbi:DUF262 domain-containing protein [Glycomyces sp. YM15]|uniref:DUF262 domain-containing protein n=1 Tax=Glycomyces sp. YM15 TaxID=2800446 RepID=UPI0019669E7B|nr:DUF262 domain-containing protein [Glycomyces sp. YM15]